MTDINHEVESIMSRGFSRDHAVKIFFANHSDLQFDPNASYNFDAPSQPQGSQNGHGGTSGGADSRTSSNGYNNGSANGRPQFQQPKSLAPLAAAQSPSSSVATVKASPTSAVPPSLQKMSSLSMSASTQQTAITSTTTTTTKQEMIAALSKSEDEEEEVSAPARTLTRLASVSTMPLTDEDEAQIQILIGQGYPRVVATQMYRQKGSLGGLNKKVLQSNMNLNDLLAVPQANNTEGQITLADYGIDPNSREAQQIIQSSTPIPVPLTDSSPRLPLSRRPSQVMNPNSGENSPYTSGSMAGSAKYSSGMPPPPPEQPMRRPSMYNVVESQQQQQQYTPPPMMSAGSAKFERKPSSISVNSDVREYSPAPAVVQVQAHEMRRASSFVGQSLSPEERENEIQVLMHAGYSRPVATEMVKQRKAGGGLDENIIEADISTHNYAADLRPGEYHEQNSNQGVVRKIERKASGTGSLTRAALENSYYEQPPADSGSFPQQQQQFQKPVTRKTSSGTLSNVTTDDLEREEDQRQIELMMSRGYTEEQARRATSLRRDQLRQQAVETRTLESRTRSSNTLPRQTSSSSNAGYSAEPSPRERGEYSMPTRMLPNNTSQSSMSLTDSPHHVRRGSSARSNEDLSFEDQAEVAEYVRQGFTEDQALAMVRHQRSKQQQQQQQPQRSQSYYSQSNYSQQSYQEQRRENSGYRDSPPVNNNAGNTRHMLQRTGSITVPPSNDSRVRSTSNINADDEALRIGILISEQDAEFGTNMYQTITVQDEPEIMRLVNMGYSTDDAVYLIFQRTYRSRNPNAYVPVPMGGSPPVQRQENSNNYREYNARDNREYREHREYRDNNNYNGSGNNSPSPDREDQRKKGFFHRPSFLKKLSGSGKDWNDSKNGSSPQKSNHKHHHQHHSQYREYDEERDRHNRYNDYVETPEEREMRLRLRYNEQDVERLTELSFTREQAIQALVENHNNYEKALTMLLRS